MQSRGRRVQYSGGTGCRVQDSGYGMQDTGYRIQDAGSRMRGK